jgi:aminoglycoside phosphotransferase family enzyme
VLLHAPVPVRGAVHALERLDVALARHANLLATRASQGRLVEGHGDLRMEHVCLLQPPVVIDCLEFNTELRQVDPFEEIAFLGLECSMAGAEWIARRLFSGCVEALADRPPPALMALYTAQRALLRARLAMSHLLDPVPRTPDKWPALAQRYLECAVAALDSDPR